MKTMKTSRFTRILLLAMVVCMLACTMLAPAAMAAEPNEDVLAARDGVVQVKLNFTGTDGIERTVNSGTAFLINEDTLLTCYHVVSLTAEDMAILGEEVGMTPQEVDRRLSYSVTLIGDVPAPATLESKSADLDVAVLKLNRAIPTKTPLTLRPSSDVQQTEVIHSIGFPAVASLLQTYNTYDSKDVNIATGRVTKIAQGVNTLSGMPTEYINTDCKMSEGNSGGPLVDEQGNVVGICQSVVWDPDGAAAASNVYLAIAIDQVIAILDNLAIDYTLAGAPAPTEPTEEVTVAPTEDEEVEPSTEATLPTVEEEEEESSVMMWVLIGAGALVVIIIVVVIIIIASSGGKKSAPAAGSGTYTPPAPPAPPTASARPAAPMPGTRPGVPGPGAPAHGGFAPAPAAPAEGAGETTVLSGGAGETTVLAKNTVNGGTLVRKRTGETVTINSEQFVIGRERKSVNYCIADNSSISRSHVRLIVRGGVTYLCDLNAANGTFVNGVKAMPRQEVALKNGDKITLADEDLEYKK